jgi:hypothetical protein
MAVTNIAKLLVAIALRGDRLKLIKIGTIKVPPPIPRNPARMPEIMPTPMSKRINLTSAICKVY